MNKILRTCILAIAAGSFLGANMATAADLEIKVMTGIAFGRDGATGKIYPNKDSVVMAGEIYVALGGDGSREVVIESDADKFSLSSKADGFSLNLADQQANMDLHEKGKIRVAIFEMSYGDLTFKGPAAVQIYDALKVKSVANLSCTRTKIETTCSLTDAAWMTIEAP